MAQPQPRTAPEDYLALERQAATKSGTAAGLTSV